MKSDPDIRSSDPRGARRARTLALALSAVLALSIGCQTARDVNDGSARGIIIVNATEGGEVRRILVNEGASVNEGAPLVEIAVRTQAQVAPQNQAEDPQARAGRMIRTAQTEIETARADVVRYEVEVQRLTPLVASGSASQGELDGARAQYEQAQQRLQRAQSAAQNAQAGLAVARQQQQPLNNSSAPLSPAETIVAVRASSAGVVSAISARVGQRVEAGQPLATLRVEQ